jgi:hypothetical protein
LVPRLLEIFDLVPIYKQHILSPVKVSFFLGVAKRRLLKGSGIVAAHILLVLLCRRKELLHFGPHIHLHDQHSVPFPFPRGEKRKAEILLRADVNKRLIKV